MSDKQARGGDGTLQRKLGFSAAIGQDEGVERAMRYFERAGKPLKPAQLTCDKRHPQNSEFWRQKCLNAFSYVSLVRPVHMS